MSASLGGVGGIPPILLYSSFSSFPGGFRVSPLRYLSLPLASIYNTPFVPPLPGE